MEALDANPDLAALAKASAHTTGRDAQTTIEAESATLTGPATVVQANPAYTGEAQWSGGAYVQLGPGSAASWAVPAADQPRLLQAIVNRVPGPAGVSVFAAGGAQLGDVQYGGGGPQGISPTPRRPAPRHPPHSAARRRDGRDRGDGAGAADSSTPSSSPRWSPPWSPPGRGTASRCSTVSPRPVAAAPSASPERVRRWPPATTAAAGCGVRSTVPARSRSTFRRVASPLRSGEQRRAALGRPLPHGDQGADGESDGSEPQQRGKGAGPVHHRSPQLV